MRNKFRRLLPRMMSNKGSSREHSHSTKRLKKHSLNGKEAVTVTLNLTILSSYYKIGVSTLNPNKSMNCFCG